MRRDWLVPALVFAILATRIGAQAPCVTAMDPAPGERLRRGPGAVTVTFHCPILASTVNAGTFHLVRSGGDGQFDNGNEAVVTAAAISATNTAATFDLTGVDLPIDVYRVTLCGPQEYAWGMPTNVTELNTRWRESHPSLSADGLTMYFASNRHSAGVELDIWMAVRPTLESRWGTPVRVAALNTSLDESGPSISLDGLEIYFDSTRATAVPHLYTASRPSATSPWRPPVHVGAPSNISSNWDPYLTRDGLSLYFASARSGQAALWLSTRIDIGCPWSAAQQVTSLAEAEEPWLSMDRLTIYFSSTRAGGLGGKDIWRATRPNLTTPWAGVTNVGVLNSPHDDGGAEMSLDGREVYVYSRRPGGLGDSDLWVSRLVPQPGTPGAITGVNGMSLDGEFTDTFPSGDGWAGGDFVAYFVVTGPLTGVSARIWRLYQ